MKNVRKKLDSWLGKPKRNWGRGSTQLIYRFNSEIPPILPLRLKVEINTREHFSVMDLNSIPFQVDSPWFSGKCTTITYSIEELLGTKLRALYQRKKGRDLFDLAQAIQKMPNLDVDKLIHCFKRYMQHLNKTITRKEFEDNLLAKKEEPLFSRDEFST